MTTTAAPPDGSGAPAAADRPPAGLSPAELAAVCPTHSLQPSLLVCNQMPALQEKDATVHV